MRVEPSAVPMKRALKKLLGVPVVGVDGLCLSKWSVSTTPEVSLVGSGCRTGRDGGVEGMVNGNHVRRSCKSAIVQ